MAKRAFAVDSLNGSTEIIKEFPVNISQTIAIGDLLVLTGGKITVAAPAAAAGTVLGVAASAITTTGSVDATDVVLVEINPDIVYSFKYTGSTKTSLTKEDIGTKFDLVTNAYTIDLDDTTGGYLMVVGFDNRESRASVVISNRALNV